MPGAVSEHVTLKVVMSCAASPSASPTSCAARAISAMKCETPKCDAKRTYSGVRHDDVGDDAGLEAAHAVGEDDRRHAAERLEALGQETQRGLATLIEGEAHEAHAAPDQDRTKMRSGPT